MTAFYVAAMSHPHPHPVAGDAGCWREEGSAHQVLPLPGHHWASGGLGRGLRLATGSKAGPVDRRQLIT